MVKKSLKIYKKFGDYINTIIINLSLKNILVSHQLTFIIEI